MSSVAKRILTGAALVTLVIVLLRLNRAYPDGHVVSWVSLALSLLGTLEVSRMPGLRAPRFALAIVIAVTAVGLFGGTLGWFQGLAALKPHGLLLESVVIVGGVTALVVGRQRLRSASLAIWGGVPLFGLIPLFELYGERGLACLVLLSKVGDIFGYFVGRAIGRRHPFPKLSPGKTVAGCVASLLSGTLAGGLLGAAGALPGGSVGWGAGLIAGLVLNLAAQAGDLLESRVKRVGGVKDSSALVGPAGGVLDVVDSLLLTVPAALILWPFLF